MTTTRSGLSVMLVPAMRTAAGCSGLRHNLFGGADPPRVGEIEHDAERIAIFRLIVGVWRVRPARQIGTAGIEHFLLRRIEIVDPCAEVVEPDLLVTLLLQERQVDDAV